MTITLTTAASAWSVGHTLACFLSLNSGLLGVLLVVFAACWMSDESFKKPNFSLSKCTYWVRFLIIGSYLLSFFASFWMVHHP